MPPKRYSKKEIYAFMIIIGIAILVSLLIIFKPNWLF
jgi:hypothetical protein